MSSRPNRETRRQPTPRRIYLPAGGGGFVSNFIPLFVAIRARAASADAANALHRQQTLTVQTLLVIPVRVRIERAEDAEGAKHLDSDGPRLLGQDAKHQREQLRVIHERSNHVPPSTR